MSLVYERSHKLTLVADVIMFSGCKDNQTSADAFINGQATGAMSHALVTALSRDHTQSFLQVCMLARRRFCCSVFFFFVVTNKKICLWLC